jgi:hypothetical protein
MLMSYTGIRGFCEEDVPEVADLHRRVMRVDALATNGWLKEYRNYFREVFLNDAARSAGLRSLVYEREGRIAGFLGVMPRRMQLQGKPLLAAVCSQFVVDPTERGQVGLQMLKRCFAGPQDFSMTDEAADCTRKVWEWCGGATALPYSLHWIRPLRPVQSALAVGAGHTQSARLAGVLYPLARAVDAVLTRAGGRVRPVQPPGSRAPLDEAALLECLRDFAGRSSMGPAYDAQSVQWVLARARRRADHGVVRALLVRDESEAVTGWFIYHALAGGPGEVLQICAEPRHHRTVLDHLFEDAWQQGVTMLLGRLDPSLAPELSEKGCLAYRRGYWTLVHSKRPEVSHALQRGDALLTRLEGEWCLRFP